MTETWVSHLQMAVHNFFARFNLGIANYRNPEVNADWQHIRKIARGIPSGTTPLEAIQLLRLVRACELIDGDLAEVGSFRGASAAIILSTSRKKNLHVFDTFEGLPAAENLYVKGEFAGSLDQVKANLREWEGRVEYHQGIFPESAAGLESLKFSFVNLDVDLYEGTLAGFRWFWPRLKPRGILLCHDYPYSPGVVKAVHEFFDQEICHPFFPLSGIQCMAVKP